MFGWLEGYTNRELRETVQKISNGEDVKTCMPDKPVTWEKLSRRIHAGVISDDDSRQEQLATGYARVWRQFASDLVNPLFQKEYNCIKHGFRARSGGFTFSFANVPWPGSEDGSHFFGVERIGNSQNNFIVHEYGVNWSPAKLVERLHLIAASISNVINRLLQWWKQPVTPDAFRYPDDFKAFQSLWDDGIKALALDFRQGVVESSIHLLSAEEILREYGKLSLTDSPESAAGREC